MSHKLTIMIMMMMMVTTLMSLAGSLPVAEESVELLNYGTAGSDNIYAASDNDSDILVYINEEEDLVQDKDYDAVMQQSNEESDEEEKALPAAADNIAAVGESETSCEYSCPRYYRPICVSRNGRPVTYATPCEYFNQLRCANVARIQGKLDTPSFKLLYNDACRDE